MARKLHWYPVKGETRTSCRPHTLDQLHREAASSLTNVTCQPCLKALGIHQVSFKASSKKAKLTLLLPNGKRPVCLVESFELSVTSSMADIDHSDAISFIGKEPEPIALKMTLTEDGWSALKEALMGRM